ncbi:UNVERIFIED_CONTAM: hypothetical protein PYX00_007169 [Menopon gallinae]|uniref:Uncharacterized protein n=1 Tax=Menopon gallinae TaxID=328185 RepID=A0AAW2HHX2_9NEOP
MGLRDWSREISEYILKDDLVDNLNIKDEIAKDLGLKDEITSALDEHKEEVAEESPRIDLSEESESLLQKLSEEDGPDAADLPTVSLEEALCLAGLDDPQQDLEKLKHHLKVLDEDREGSDVDEEEEDFLNEMIQTAQFHTPQTPHPRTFQ